MEKKKLFEPIRRGAPSLPFDFTDALSKIKTQKELLNETQNTKDFPVRITFEVTCDSHTSMFDGETLKERILDYMKQCTDAMDDSMRHWGEHVHCIETVKIELYDGEQIDITEDILDK